MYQNNYYNLRTTVFIIVPSKFYHTSLQIIIAICNKLLLKKKKIENMFLIMLELIQNITAITV